MSQSRQLAAIMFTDIVGYTELMGKDEKNAFVILNKNRELQKSIIEKFNGNWIKELGDGVMASFSTVSDAVYAAIKILEQCRSINEFQLRIGIHAGEVVLKIMMFWVMVLTLPPEYKHLHSLDLYIYQKQYIKIYQTTRIYNQSL